MAKRPTDTDPLPRRMVDTPAVTPPICGHTEDRGDRPYVCAKNPGHLGGHTMTRADGEIVRKLAGRTAPAGGFFDVPESPTDVAAMQTPSRPETLPAVPPDGVQAADPAQPTPESGGSEPSGETTASPAGSGDGSGRPSHAPLPYAGIVDDPGLSSTDEPGDQLRRGSGGGSGGSLSLVRPDASEAVLAAAGGVLNPAAEPGHAITHAEEFARLLVVGMHFGRMLQANADKQLVGADDVRAVYRKMRQIAATHAIDLDDEGGDR